MELAVLQYKKNGKDTQVLTNIYWELIACQELTCIISFILHDNWIKYYYVHFIWAFMAKQRETKLRSKTLDLTSCLSDFEEWTSLTVKLIPSQG